MRVFLAGATGAIGSVLARLLIRAGHTVFGSTRHATRTLALRGMGVEPVVVDAFDAQGLSAALATARPDAVIHQLTDLAGVADPAGRAEALTRNARIRSEGTCNLVAAALHAGVHHLIAQSIAWAYAPGPQPYSEDDPLDKQADGERGITLRGVMELERLTLYSPALQGVVLRYGQLYGPGSGRNEPTGSAPVHVDAAALAAMLAIDTGGPEVFNIAEDTGFVSIAKARRVLGWDPSFRLGPPSSVG